MFEGSVEIGGDSATGHEELETGPASPDGCRSALDRLLPTPARLPITPSRPAHLLRLGHAIRVSADARRTPCEKPARGSSEARFRIAKPSVGNRIGGQAQRFRRSAAFGSNRQGVVAVETALLGLPFFLLISGVVVIGFMSFCHSTLDYATRKASRQLMIGNVQNQNLSVNSFISQDICPYLTGAVFTCSNVVVNLVVVPETPEPTGWTNYVSSNSSYVNMPPLNNAQNKYCLGAGSSYQLLEVLYPLPIYLSFLGATSNVVQNQYVILSTAAFKNEPFAGGAAASPGC